jgi:hypothetical protein
VDGWVWLNRGKKGREERREESREENNKGGRKGVKLSSPRLFFLSVLFSVKARWGSK